MKIKQIIGCASLIAGLLAVGLAKTQAQNVYVADTGLALTNPAAWVGGVPATPAQIAAWNHTVQVNTTSTLGAKTAWAGIQILDPGAPITLAADGNALTNGASGIDLSQATNGLTLNNPLVLGANQTWQVTNGLTLTVAGVVSGSGVLTLNNGGNNTGTISLGSANTFTGGTVINSGIIQPGNATSFGPAANNLTNNGATLLFSTFPAGGIIANNEIVNGNTYVDMYNRSISVVLDGAFAGSGTVYVTNDTASGSTLTFGGNGPSGSGNGNFTGFTGSIIVMDTNASGTASAGTLRFNNGGTSANLGNAGMTLNLGGPNSAIHFTEKNSGTTTHFGALIGGPNTQLASVETYVVGEANLNTTFAGTISGSTASLTKSGTGVLILTGNNVNSGATVVNAGTLQIGDGVTTGQGALGSHAISVVAPGTLYYDRPDAITLNNNISGSGAWLVNAPLGLTYGGVNSSSGATTISGGSLLLTSAGVIDAPIYLAAGTTFDVTANSTFSLISTLSGFGNVNGLLTASMGGGISPGNLAAASGTLTFNSGLIESGAVNNTFYLSTPTGTNDLVNVTGNLTLNGTNLVNVLNFNGGAVPTGIYPLINYSGTLNGGVTNLTASGAGITCILTNPPGQIAVIISPAARGATNLTWVGDGGLNQWDTASTNWVNGVNRFLFQTGDSVLFSDNGATNNAVDLVQSVTPAAVVVNSTSNYLFYGVSGISGSTGLTKTNSGTLTISATNSYTGPTIVGGGVLEVLNVANGSLPSALGAASGNATNLVFYNGTTFQYSSADQPSMDRNVTLNSGNVTINITNGSANFTENGVLGGAATLTKFGPGTLTLASPDTYAGGTVISNGVLALGSNLANNSGGNGSGVGATNNPVTFYGGTLRLYGVGLSSGNNYSTFYNPLVVPAGQTGTLVMFPRGAINTGGGAGVNCSLSGAGTLNLEVNYVRDALSGNWSAFTGLILVSNLNASGDEMRINNNYGYSNAAIYLNGTFTMDSTLTADATINIGELGGVSTAIIGPGAASAPGPIWCVGWKNTTNTFAGTIEDDNTAPGGQTFITKVGTGTWYLSGQNTFTGSTTVSNGVLALIAGPNGDGSISSSTNLFVSAGSFLDYTGVSDGTLHLQASQTFSGNGTLRGILDTTPGGTVAPGGIVSGAIKTLTVTSNANLGGTAWMKLSRGSSPNSDRLVADQPITYGGTLVITNIGAPLQVGDTFTLFSTPTATFNGAFASIVEQTGYTFDTSHLAVNGSVTVTGIPTSPSFSGVDFSSLSSGTIVINATNGPPNANVNVLTSTNLALPLSSWTVNSSTTLDGSGNLSAFSITVNPALPQLFILLQAQ